MFTASDSAARKKYAFIFQTWSVRIKNGIWQDVFRCYLDYTVHYTWHSEVCFPVRWKIIFCSTHHSYYCVTRFHGCPGLLVGSGMPLLAESTFLLLIHKFHGNRILHLSAHRVFIFLSSWCGWKHASCLWVCLCIFMKANAAFTYMELFPRKTGFPSTQTEWCLYEDGKYCHLNEFHTRFFKARGSLGELVTLRNMAHWL